MKNLKDYSDFQLSARAKKTVLGGAGDSGIIDGTCTPDSIGDAIRKKLGL